jgi:hypothetical protein
MEAIRFFLCSKIDISEGARFYEFILQDVTITLSPLPPMVWIDLRTKNKDPLQTKGSFKTPYNVRTKAR